MKYAIVDNQTGRVDRTIDTPEPKMYVRLQYRGKKVLPVADNVNSELMYHVDGSFQERPEMPGTVITTEPLGDIREEFYRGVPSDAILHGDVDFVEVENGSIYVLPDNGNRCFIRIEAFPYQDKRILLSLGGGHRE